MLSLKLLLLQWHLCHLDMCKILMGFDLLISTHCGPLMPYGSTNLGLQWFRQWLVTWWHQAITWTNADLSSMRSSCIHLRVISNEMLKIFSLDLSLKITNLSLHLPGANGLNDLDDSFRQICNSLEIASVGSAPSSVNDHLMSQLPTIILRSR